MISAFRSIASQKAVFDQNVTMLMSQGQNKEKAIETTKRTMTEPGYSEHHTGLAVEYCSITVLKIIAIDTLCIIHPSCIYFY